MWVPTCSCSGCRLWWLVASGNESEGVRRAGAQAGWAFNCQRDARSSDVGSDGSVGQGEGGQVCFTWLCGPALDDRLVSGAFGGGILSESVPDGGVSDGAGRDSVGPGADLGSRKNGVFEQSSDVGVSEQSEIRPAGRWAASNRRKKLRRKSRADVPVWRRGAVPVGRCETVASDVSGASGSPPCGQVLSDAEREAKESLARRRAAENALKEKLAKLKLAELEDEKRCAEIADLKHQRIIQWTNEATAKSQQSLDKVKSIDPSSSASQYEIRQQAKKLADSEAEVRRISSIVKTLSPDWQELLERKAESTFNTEYIDELMAKGEAGLDNGFRY